MRFQVPQFIETESKIVGPFTLKQFLFIAPGVGIVFLLRYAFTSFAYWVLVSLPILALALALAFYKIDGMPLPSYLVKAFTFMLGTKKYTFRKDESADYGLGITDSNKNND
ncbi:MAG: PrgI family protein [Patescibacteria group bacterium]